MNDGALLTALLPDADGAPSTCGTGSARALSWPAPSRGERFFAAPQPTGPVRIVLIEEHAGVRMELRRLLALNDDIHVVGESATAAEGIDMALRLQPDVVLTDLSLPDREGPQLVSDLRRFAPGVKVIVVAAHYDEQYACGALVAGTHGYVLMDAGREGLVLALHAVLAGQRYLCASVAARVISSYLEHGVITPSASLGRLTSREREVLRLIAMGKPNRAIAHDLGLSAKTVEKDRGNFMRKLGIYGAVAIAHFAFQSGVITFQDLQGAERAA